MKVERLVEMLATELKLPAIPQKDKNGCYQLKINAEMIVSIKELEPGLFIQSPILPLPKEGNKETLFIHLMKANLLGQGTGGASIGIDENEKHLILSQTLPFEVNYKTFHETLEDFLNYTAYWKEEVPKLQTTIM